MPGVGRIRRIEPPAERHWERPYVFADPSSEWELRFHDPWEFAMGGYAWDVSLLHRSAHVRSWNDGGEPETLRPWAADGGKFAFPLCSRAGNRLYGATTAGHDLPLPDWPRDEYLVSVQWAPRPDRLLALGRSECLLIDETGSVIARPSWEEPEYSHPTAGWIGNGEHFFVLSPESGRDVRFYSAEDGALSDAFSLDPADVVPYDAAAYEHVDRDSYALGFGPGTAGVGGLLDTWGEAHFDYERSALRLSIARPTGDTAPIDGEQVPTVRTQWVAVELVP